MIDATAPTPDPAPSSPVWRSPWLVAFIAGAITITLLRDCTRRVPDAPDSIGAVPSWSIQQVESETISSQALSGHIHILAFGAADCSAVVGTAEERSERIAACGVATEAAAALQQQIQKKQGVARLVVLDVSTNWLESMELASGLARLGDVTIDNPWDLGFILVDSAGQCRGFYGLHEEGQDEILHRSQHVARDEAKRS